MRRHAISPVMVRASRRRSAFRRSASLPVAIVNRTRIGPLRRKHRGHVAEILKRTAVFRPEEIAIALELFDESYPATDSSAAVDISSIPHSTPLSSDYTFLGAFTPEDELIGYACYGPTPDTDRTYDLYWIAVDPASQGSGSGTILLLEVERRLQGLNARMLVVETSSRSEYAPTRGFYLRHAYAEAARTKDFYAPADDRIIFTKRFHPLPTRPVEGLE